MKTSTVLIATILGLFSFGCGDSDESPTESATGGEGGAAPSTGGSSPKATGGGDNADDETGGSGTEPGPSGGDAGAGEDPATGGSSGSAGSPETEGNAGASAGGAPGTGGASGGGNDATFGFSIRAPEERSVNCTDVADPQFLYDEDFVCTFRHGTVDGYVYLQATPTDCQVLMGPTPTSFDAAAWISIDGVADSLDAVAYDHGGNHFNNTIEFSYLGSLYRIAHSSIGFGGRSCQPPDCIQVYEQDGATLVEDGCTVERTLPVVCVAVETGGVVPELADTFAPCPGDPNYAEETTVPVR